MSLSYTVHLLLQTADLTLIFKDININPFLSDVLGLLYNEYEIIPQYIMTHR